MPRNHRNTGRYCIGHRRRHGPGSAHRSHHHNRHRSPSPSPPRGRHHWRSNPRYEYVSNLVNLFNYGGRYHDWDFNRLRLNEEENKPKPDPSDKDVLSVEKVDFLVPENTRRHHTDEFDMTRPPNNHLVVRRGEPFNIKVQFSRSYNTATDDLRLVFEIGDNPKPSKGSHVEFVLSDKDEAGKWGAKIKGQSGNSLEVTIFTPPDLGVGEWSFKVDVVKKKDDKTSIFRYNHDDPIHILFNPWCKEDAVFLDSEQGRKDYVLEDTGKIYSGNYKKISPKPWAFGQFEKDVLDCCMYLLDLSGLNVNDRGDPIKMVRKLSALINSADEGGVLTGNWSGDYSGGKSPLSWTGSAPILQQYYETKYAVRFGQCWVFSGVFTTVCRALGIPARSVTNFASAHDVDASITIDSYYSAEGDPLEDMNEDSVWNFHVWNETWMSRPDLPPGYGGWQAVDATPQEVSGDVYCCGPASIRAIKEGEVHLPYDGPFIFAEVNADRMYWQQQYDGSTECVHVQQNAVGKFISTMSHDRQREDVTLHYKHEENSAEERVAVRRANQRGSGRRDAYKEGPKDVVFEMKFDADNTYVGSPFEVPLQCTNKSQENRELKGRITANTMYYTGISADLVSRMDIDIKLKPGETKTVALPVNFDDYDKKLKDCCMLLLSTMVRVTETKQIFSDRDDVRLRKPHLVIKAPANGQVEQDMELQVSFSNPMQCTLTDCSLDVEGPGITTAVKHPQSDVQAKGTFACTIKVKPVKAGNRQLVIIFNSKQLEDINGTHDVIVKP